MPKYHVVNVSVMHITTTHEVIADSETEAEELVDDNQGTFLSQYEKYVDGDSWVTEVE